MNEILYAVLMGVIQGLTEFLPISSSAHLIVVQYLFTTNTDKSFVVAIHLATTLAIVIYFYKKIIHLSQDLLSKDKYKISQIFKQYFFPCIYGTLPVLIVAPLVKYFDIEKFFLNPFIIGISSILFGIIMLLAYLNSKENKDQITYLDITLIGLSQLIAAVIPGASRSGISLTSALLLGLNKKLSIKVVFLLSIPITVLASLQEITTFSFNTNTTFLVAFISSFISGLLSIHILRNIVNFKNMVIITVYRILFGIFCLYLGYVYIL